MTTIAGTKTMKTWERVVAFAAILLAVSGCSGPATTALAATSAPTAFHLVEDASSLPPIHEGGREALARCIRLATAELVVTGRILDECADLASDPAFSAFLTKVERAVEACEQKGSVHTLDESDLVALSVGLASARNELAGNLSSLAPWIALNRATNPEAVLIKPPSRFVRVSPVALLMDAEDPSDEIADFDSFLS